MAVVVVILLRVSTTWASRPGHGTVFNDNRSMPREFSNFRHVSPVRNDSSRDFSGLDSTRFGRERHDSTPRTFLPGTRIPQDIQGASRTARVVTSCFERQHGGYPGSAGCTSSLPTLTGSLTHARPLSFDKDLRWGGIGLRARETPLICGAGGSRREIFRTLLARPKSL